MPQKPKLVDASVVQFKTWDQYLEEADVEPFRLPVSEDETLVIEAPTSDDLQALGLAQQRGDLNAMAVAVFGEQAGRILQLCGGKSFVILNRLVRDVMRHFNAGGGALPEV